MRNGDCNVNVYWASSTTAAIPIPAAMRRSNPKSLAGIRCDFARLPRARFGAAADIRWHLWAAGTLGQKCFVKIVELISKEKDVAGAFFDQITTAAWQGNRSDRILGGTRRMYPRRKRRTVSI
jgi:hypothetical protein